MGLLGNGTIGKAYGSTIFGSILNGGLSGGGGAKPPGGLNAPKFAMRKTTDFLSNDAAPQIGGANGRQTLEGSFAGIKENAANQANAALTGNSNAINRRFAAMGAGNSGAAIKALETVQNQSEQANLASQNNIDFQKNQALEGHDVAQANMDFQQKVFNFDSASKMHALDLQERQQQIDSSTTEFNGRLAQFQAQPPKQGIISNALGSFL